LYADLFEQHSALDKLEGFASFFGADFYCLPRNKGRVTLTKSEWEMPANYKFGSDVIIPICADETLRWSLDEKL
jgi:dihydroorotase